MAKKPSLLPAAKKGKALPGHTPPAETPVKAMTMNDVEKLVDAKLKAFEAELVAARCIQPRPE